jgi:adenylate kinase
VREFALQVADHYKFTTISVGDLLKKEVSKKQELGEEIESYFKHYTIVKDDIVTKMVKKEIEGIQKEKKSFILSGFPRTRVQGLGMQR